jgi:uncharacterized protein (TIGR00251 family)
MSGENETSFVNVRVITRASRSEIAGWTGDTLKVKLTSPPVDGAANAELIRLLAKTLGIARSDVTIVSGETSRNKRIKIDNLSASKVNEVIR